MSVTEHESQERIDKARRAELDAQAERDELCWLMSDAKGRRYMWRLLELTGIYHTSFSSEPLEMAFKEGQRNVGLRLVRDLQKHCPQRFSEMQRESRTNERRKAS